MIKKNRIIKTILLFGDFALMYLALYFALILRGKGLIFDYEHFAYHFTFLFILWLPFIYALDFYEINYFQKSSPYRLSILAMFYLFLGISYFYLMPNLIFTPKTILILNIVIYIIIFYIWRKFFYRAILKNKKQKIIVIGSFLSIEKIKNQIKNKGFEILASFDPKILEKGKNSEFIDFIAKNDFSFIVFTNDYYNNQEFLKLINNISWQVKSRLCFINYNDFYEIVSKKVYLNGFSELLFLEKMSFKNDKIYFILKRIFDLILGFLFFLVTIVLFPFVALAIKVDSKGSVFYKQERVGQDRKIFTVYKFRTMQENDSQHKEIWREKKENQITRVGYFLRRFHLDELPQSISILKGSLSFVGPRPEWIKIDEIFQKDIPFYSYRYLTKPGFTGWAQINFKPSNSVEEAKEKFEYDLYYMKNKSIIFDVEIVLKTLRLLMHRHS